MDESKKTSRTTGMVRLALEERKQNLHMFLSQKGAINGKAKIRGAHRAAMWPVVLQEHGSPRTTTGLPISETYRLTVPELLAKRWPEFANWACRVVRLFNCLHKFQRVESVAHPLGNWAGTGLVSQKNAHQTQQTQQRHIRALIGQRRSFYRAGLSCWSYILTRIAFLMKPCYSGNHSLLLIEVFYDSTLQQIPRNSSRPDRS